MHRFSKMLILLCLLCSFLAAQQTATTSVPNLIRYTGTLKDVQGKASVRPTTIGVTFAIYKEQEGGAPIWQETQNVTLEANGQYSVLLGSSAAAGMPDDLFSQKEDRWLGVQVQGQEEQARVMLVSVPYAFKAHEADTLGGLPASAFVKAASSDGSAGQSGYEASAANPATTVGSPSGKDSPARKSQAPCSLTNNYLIFYQSGNCASSVYESTTSPTTGFIGILNSAPAQALDVTGTINTSQRYDIFDQPILYVGNPGTAASTNLMVGFQAGASNTGSYDTFVGREAGINHVGGDADVYVGYRAGDHNSGTSNVSIGYQSGFNNNHGNYDVFIGRSDGFNSTGSSNTCVGFAACYNTTASNNTAYGYQSGESNTSGAQNTYLGNNAGNANKTGNGNTFVGNAAGQNNTDPGGNNCCNTYLGDNAGLGAVGNSAGGNTCLGYRTCEAVTTGGKNTASGWKTANVMTSGSFNSFYGDQAGQNLTTGNYNTMLGISAGGTNFVSGDSNTFIGAFAGNQENGVSNNIEIGNQGPSPTGSNTIMIGTLNQHTATFLAGIATGGPSGLPSVVVDPATGRLWQGPAGGGLTGNCPPPTGGNYITQWLTMTSVGCSGIFQQTTTNFIGIGNTNPSAMLDVSGDISANSPASGPDRTSYQIAENTVLSAYGDRNIIVGFTGAHATNANQQNTIVGANAGQNNTSGDWNVFMGSAAGYSNVGGYENVFIGQVAGRDNVSGHDNTYIGEFAGTVSNASGSYNTYVGEGTGQDNNGGNSNIYLMNLGTNESNTIRIGQQGTGDGQQNSTYIAGIYQAPIGTQNYPVCIDATGKLGSLAACNPGSSRRFKDQIADMGDSSSKLFQLRPVTFLYKPQYDDGSHALQYGLIAEEVAKVYPEMAIYDKDGQPSGVKYQMLTPMLLSELQKEHAVVLAEQEELQSQLQQIKLQKEQIDNLNHQMQLQTASLQERLEKLESAVAPQLQTASSTQPAAAAATTGGLQ